MNRRGKGLGLRFKLNALLVLLSLVILMCGAAVIVHNAKRFVAAEMQATATLTTNLLEVALTGADADSGMEAALLRRLGKLQEARYLGVEISSAGKSFWRLDRHTAPAAAVAPQWFISLLGSEPFVLRRAVHVTGLPGAELLVKARPYDEVAEAWEEAKAAFALLLALSVLTLGLVSFAIGRALKPVAQILDVLEDLGAGNYAARLPEQVVGDSELGRIGGEVNDLAQALQESVMRARDLDRRSLDIQEQERRFLAQELHDEMGQSLSAIRAIAVSVASEPDKHAEEVIDSAQTIARVAGETYDTVRGMMHRLRPPALDELGMARALQQLVTDWNARHAPAHCNLAVQDLHDSPGEDVDIHLYRIIQEALTNVARHAQARQVNVELSSEAGRIKVSIRDDGCGFDPLAVREGLGLVGMRERVNAILGEITVESAAHKGTLIQASVPMAQ